ncbi:hypothetical protein R5W24_005227, partial [Gemmata sp. JC717]|uniref:AbiJ-NTD4 domain-containing protein n=1 Tax=Gemmata algarum TaxID=2975278 RepID=UPI0021BB7194
YFSPHYPWYGVYDLLQGACELPFNADTHAAFVEDINAALEKENSGYRMVNGEFCPITNELELEAVRTAGASDEVAAPMRIHFQQALEHLSNRENPDYRNSMKESITAIEVLCRAISGMKDATFTPAMEKTVKELGLTEHIREGYRNIFKYTCDDHGIRHGLKDGRQPEQEDARFMLVTCSAFANFIIEKARKLGKIPKYPPDKSISTDKISIATQSPA